MRNFCITLILILLVSCAAFAAQQTPRPFVFGLNIGMSDEQCKAAKEAGCTSVRIGCGWDLVEKEPGKYDFSDPDRDVAQSRKYGFEPFFLIVATPKFYLKEEMRDKPWGWPALPEYYPQAAKFYKTLAERYKGKVKYYEFWNEPNGYSWHAINKPEEYAPILKVAYKALKEGDPDCVVAIGGLDGAGWKGYYKYIEKLYDLGCKDYFDAVTVHPYRSDGPIDTYGLKRVYSVMKDHGDGDKKIWITEYGWSKEYGHEIKAKWLKESLDLLTSPELDFVFQASVHTLTDFDDTEFGLCDRNLNPRPAYYAFKDYPKDWSVIAKNHSAPGSVNQSKIKGDGFEGHVNLWTSYGDGLKVAVGKDIGITTESGRNVMAAVVSDRALEGGAYRVVETAPGLPVRVEARVYTDQKGESASNSQLRIGIDPTGGTDPKAQSVEWGRWKDTSGVWDTGAAGRTKRVVSESGKITIFLDYIHKGGAVGQMTAFDSIEITAREDL